MFCVKKTAPLHTHTHIHTYIYIYNIYIFKEVCVYIYVLYKNYSINGFSVAIPSWLEIGGYLIHFGLATKVQTAN